MFAYCGNNPVLLADDNGKSATIAGAIIGGIFGALSGILGGGSVKEVIACAVSGAVTGAIAGFIADVSCATFGVGGAIIASAVAGGACSVANSIATQSILNDGKIDHKKVASDFVFGAICGGLCTAMAPLKAFQSLGLKEGLSYVSSMLMAEETMIITQAIGTTVSCLAFDVGATAVTGFGAFVGGLAYDYHTATPICED